MRMNGHSGNGECLEWEADLLRGANVDLNFKLPDLHELKQARQKRNESIFHKIHATIFDKINKKIFNNQDKAAIKIQKVFRGYLGRNKYIDMLYDSVVAGEEALRKQQEAQISEGEILIENYRIERDLDDSNDINRNKSRLLHNNATIIQRAWRDRENSIKSHVCCACKEDYPDLYEYYNETKTICFCCDEHRINPSALCIPNDYYFECETETLPYPSTDWLSIDSVLTKYRSPSNISTNDIEELKSRLCVNQDVKLTFVESYEADNNDHDVEVYQSYDDITAADIYHVNIEKVTDTNKNRSPDDLEPVEESTRVLKSLEIHEEHEKKLEQLEQRKKSSHDSFSNKGVSELREIINSMEAEIGVKNTELVQELMIRDELYTQHESLLMDADDLAKRKK